MNGGYLKNKYSFCFDLFAKKELKKSIHAFMQIRTFN